MKIINRTLPLLLAGLLVAPASQAFNWNFNIADIVLPATPAGSPTKPPIESPNRPPTGLPAELPAELPAPEGAKVSEPILRVVQGAATKGPIAGAEIRVFSVNSQGFPLLSANGNALAPIAETTSDASGRFTVSVPDTEAAYLVQSFGGSFIDESDQRPLAQRRRITLNNSQGFSSIIMPSQTEVAITPFTDLIVERARFGSRLASAGDPLNFLANVTLLKAASADGFGFDLFSTIPANPISPAADASHAQKQYALLLGSVANIANTSAIQMGLSTPTYGVIRDVILDSSDGSTDGRFDGNPIINSDSGLPLPAIDFDQQLVRFRNNNYRHYVGVDLPEWNDGAKLLGLRFPSVIFAVREEGVGQSFSVDDIESLGKIELDASGQGTSTDEDGAGVFAWDSFGDSLRIDFSGIGGKAQDAFMSNETNNVGGTDDIQFSEFIDRIDITLIDFSSTPLKATARLQGRSERVNLTTGAIENTITNEEYTISLFDGAKTPAFPSPTTFEFMPALPVRIGEDDQRKMGVGLLEFNDDGTGVSAYLNDPFNWTLPGDNSLRLDFASGEFANYYVLRADSDGTVDGGNDFVVVDYFDGDKLLHTGSVVFSKSPVFEWIESEIPGSYVTKNRSELDSGALIEDEVVYHVYPDKTGVVEFKQIDPVTGLATTNFSSNKICWELNSQGNLVRKRFRLDNGGGVRGQLPLVSRCASLPDQDISWFREHDLFDRLGDGITIQTVVQEFQNPCDDLVNSDPACQPLVRSISFPAQYEIIPLSATPPIPLDDLESTLFNTALTINVLANDIPGDLSIDPSTLTVDNGPFEANSLDGIVGADGVAVVNALNQIVYTPDGTNTSARNVRMAYRVSDVAGNRSIAGFLEVSVLSEIVPPPTFAASPASLSDIHNVGIDPCSDPINTVTINSSSGGDFSITGITVVGEINGVIDAISQTPGSQAPSQLLDVSFNCSSADPAQRSGSIVINTVDIATGSPSSVTVPVIHEVVASPPTVAASPASLSDVHNVGSSPCPDPISSVQVTSSDGGDILINNVAVTGNMSGFIVASDASPGGAAPTQIVDVQFNCASASGATRTGNITIDTTNIGTGTTSSVVVSVTHQVIP